tara:strand:+ start:12 stop:179 length:168 start_codon:yes stop_codon:yes gene_type:complete
MNIPLIAEIGLNHFGNEKFLAEYQKILSKKKIDGISIQIPPRVFNERKPKKIFVK